MSIARLDREVSSPELTRWLAWYRVRDAAKSGKLDELRHEVVGDR
jgi:hypothetical protein